MNIVTELTLTLSDGMEIRLDSLHSRYAAIMPRGNTVCSDALPLSDLRDLLLSQSLRALVLYRVDYQRDDDLFDDEEDEEDEELEFDDEPEYVTITVFPQYIINIVSNDMEVPLKV